MKTKTRWELFNLLSREEQLEIMCTKCGNRYGLHSAGRESWCPEGESDFDTSFTTFSSFQLGSILEELHKLNHEG
jgi:hypothetical protein